MEDILILSTGGFVTLATSEKALVEIAKDAPGPVVDVTVEVLVAAKEHGANSFVAPALARLIRAVVVAVSHNENALLEVVSAPSDLHALVLLLSNPVVIESLSNIDPLAPAKVRGIFRKAELYQAEGGCVSGEEAGRLVGRSRQAIDKARSRGDVLALPSGKDGWTYPVWQFVDGRFLPGLKNVLEILKDEGAFVQCSFLLSKNSLLDGERPVALLRREKVQPVLNAAKAFGVHGGA